MNLSGVVYIEVAIYPQNCSFGILTFFITIFCKDNKKILLNI